METYASFHRRSATRSLFHVHRGRCPRLISDAASRLSVIARAAIFAGLTNLDYPRKPPPWAAPARGQIPLYRKTQANPHNQPKNAPPNRPIRRGKPWLRRGKPWLPRSQIGGSRQFLPVATPATVAKFSHRQPLRLWTAPKPPPPAQTNLPLETCNLKLETAANESN
jgi:hypothetical protein